MRRASAWLLQTEDFRQDEAWGPGRCDECFGKEKREQGNYSKSGEAWVQGGRPAVPSPSPSREWSCLFLSIWDAIVPPTVLDWAGLAGFAWWAEDLWVTTGILCQLSHGEVPLLTCRR